MADAGTTDCIIWQRAKNNRGYGVQWFDGKLRLAHRVAFFKCHGRWPADGLVVDHICEVKACVNPDHLRELTNRENILRAPKSPMNVARTSATCPKGHPYLEVPRRTKRGWRICDTCASLRGEIVPGGPSHSMV